ncbi:MAG: T9SS type A sorting domain-containing protein [Crocinitomicaceae bacterium]|nr:T9SS type A sorting domain-containing protein [Crocinitomicaceae bacterium]
MKSIFSFFTLTLFIVINNVSEAQFVTISDPFMASWLQTNYPACISGYQMDTTCNAIVSETSLNIYDPDIYDFNGIQYFDNLDQISIAGNNQMFMLPPLPVGLDTFNIYSCPNFNGFLYPLPNNLKIFHANGCQLLYSIPNYPDSLIELHLTNTSVNLANIPGSIPAGLKSLLALFGNTDSIPALPNELEVLQLFAIPLNPLYFPNPLPDSLVVLGAGSLNLTSLPPLPGNLQSLNVSGNNLSTLPNLPSGITYLDVSFNPLTQLPTLPTNLDVLSANNCDISCLPIIPEFLTILNLQSNPFTCVRNYTPIMYSSETWLLSYPYCQFMDTITNPYGCPTVTGISGAVFNDSIQNCTPNYNNPPASNIPVKLTDSTGTLLFSTASLSQGDYFFNVLPSSYTVSIDTLNKPYKVNCPYPGVDSTVSFTFPDSLIENVDFLIECDTSIDVGVTSIYTNGWVSPGQFHLLNVFAGDLTDWYNLNCPIAGSGTVTINVSGPVNYVAPSTGTLTPTVTGQTFTYTIPDFDAVNFYSDFGLQMQVPATAQLGANICVSVDVTFNGNDINPGNNSLNICYPVVVSYDPNMKLVSPAEVPAEYNDWLYYTIHFQNMGTGPAFNVILRDTLSTKLDLSTFEVIGYKHTNQYHLADNELYVHFQNIMLPDSASDPEGSQGYFQYRIKPINGIGFGDSIMNTAHIYFDYNPAIVTNTAVTHFIDNATLQEHEGLNAILYPNPNNGWFQLKINNAEDYQIQIFGVDGRRVYDKNCSSPTESIDLNGIDSGTYFAVISSGNGKKVIQFIIQ